MIFKEQLTNISTVLNNTGNTTKLLTSFSALDASQQKVLLSSKLLTEEQKEQCIVMSMLSSANTKYTAEQLSKTAGISAETLANWGLTSSTDTLTVSELAEKAATDAQAKSTLEKIVAQNAQAVANGELTASNVTLTASETGTTLATGAFTTAIKANISAMKTWLLTTPAGWITMLVSGIFLAVKAYDALTVSVEEQKEKMENSLSAYNDAKSELKNITTELGNQEQAMDELLGKEKLTYAEKGQLEELQQITEELRIQKNLAEKEESRTQKEVASDAATLFKKQFGIYDISNEAIDEYQTNANATGNNAILVSDENDLSAMIAGYKQFNDLLDEAYGEKNQEDIDHFTSLTEDLKDSIFSTAQDLQTQQDNMSDYYNTIKNIPYDELTSDQKEVVDAYTAISNIIALIYKELDPNSWNEMQIDKLFTTDGIEKTKDELVEMAKEGILDENTIKSYSKLNSILEDSNMILNDGQSAASALCDEMYALADAEDDFQSSKLNETPIFSKSDMISSINELSEGFEELDKIFSSISDKNPFDFKLLDDKAFKETFSGLGTAYEDFVEKISSSPNNIEGCKEAFNDLVTEWIDSVGILDKVDESTAQLTISMLENMGVANAEELVTESLAAKTEALALQKEFAAQTGDELASATADEVIGFLDEAGASETTRQYLFALIAQEQVFNAQGLDVSGKIAALKDLAAQYGQTALAAKIAHAEEQAQKSHTSLTASDYAGFVEDVNSAMNKVQVNYAGGNKSNKSGSGGSKKDAWKEAYEKELAELEHLHEMGLISDEEYYNQRIALNEKYFGEASGQHEKYLDDYRKNEEQIAEGLKKLWQDYWNDYKDNLDKVSSYAEKLFQRKIDELNKQKDNSDDSYNKEIDSIESVIKALEDKRDKEKEYWQEQIDAVQDEIDAMQDANNERERALNLQQKMYNLQKAMSQRTILQYSEDKGLHYVTNDSDIKNAKEEVEQAKFDITIADLQKQKEALEDKLDDLNDKYDLQIEKLNHRKETIEKNMDSENKKIEEQIALLEEQKSKWTEVEDNINFALLEKDMMSKYGNDVVDKILSGNADFLNSFISDYEHVTGIIHSLNDSTLTDIMNMVNQFGTSAENIGGIAGQIAGDVGSIEDSAQKVTDASNSADTSNLNTNLNNTSNASIDASEKIQNATDALNNLSTEISNYEVPSVNVDNLMATFGEDGTVLTQLASFVERFKEICSGIPEAWNGAFSDAFGTGGGNGDPLAGGSQNDGKYEKLFTPMVTALESCKTAMDMKLQECTTIWTQFQSDLANVIGVGKSSGKDGSMSSPIVKNSNKNDNKENNKGDKNSGAGADTVVGAIESGGEQISSSITETWIPAFQTLNEEVCSINASIVDCVNEMATSVVDACIAAIKAINAAEKAAGGSGHHSVPDKFQGAAHNSHIGSAFAKGTDELKHDEKNALRSEYGQTELTVYPNGKYEITNEPTVGNLPKGTAVYNEEQTKKILNNKGTSFGKAYANGTVNKPSVLDRLRAQGYEVQKYEWKDMYGNLISPQQMNEAAKAWMSGTYECLTPMNDFKEKIKETVKVIEGANVINNTMNQQQPITVTMGDIHLHEVQDVDGLSKAIIHQMPGKMLQAIHQR